MTPSQLEAAARKYCELTSRDPDAACKFAINPSGLDIALDNLGYAKDLIRTHFRTGKYGGDAQLTAAIQSAREEDK
jgi:hypothetical protein